jgi:hypothetical protein
MLQEPIGFVALCQCGKVFGVVDYANTDRVEANKTIANCIRRGCLIIPRFEGICRIRVEPCVCGTPTDEIPYRIENLGNYLLRRKQNNPLMF